MKPRGLLLFLALANTQCSCRPSAQSASAPSASGDFTETPSAEVKQEPERAAAAPVGGPIEVYSNTMAVEAMVGREQTLWVATHGGLEQYDLKSRKLLGKFTTLSGLPTLALESVTLTKDGLPIVTTLTHRCVMHGPTQRFACAEHVAAAPLPPSESTERIEGSPVKARYRSPDGHEWLGTAGLGVWERHLGQLRQLTARNQIVSNHIVATAAWKHGLYLASFDSGLGRFERGQFSLAVLDARLLNDVIATPNAIFVAASDGLYTSNDGEHFRRDPRITERFVSDLAYDARRNVLYATATNSLWEIPLGTHAKPVRATYVPGGSHSLQAVDVSQDGTVYLATEDRGVLRRDGKRKFATFDRLSGYPSSWATDVLALNDKSALFGSLHNGVFSVGDGSTRRIASEGQWTLFLGRGLQEGGPIFVGTQGGATVVDGATFRVLVGLPNPCVHTIQRYSSGLWVGTEGGLALYE